MIRRLFSKSLKPASTLAANITMRTEKIEEAFKQYLRIQELPNNRLKTFLESTPNPTFNSLSLYFNQVKTKLDILYTLKCIEEVAGSNEFSVNQLSLDLLAKKVIEKQTEFDMFDMIALNEVFAKLSFHSERLLQILEDRILEDKVLIYRQKDKAMDTIKTIVNIYMTAGSPRSELIFELARGVRVMHRENVISDRKLLETIKTMLKAGNCHGLSGLIESKLEVKKKSFKEIIQAVEIAIPLKLLTKEKTIAVEEHLLDYMRLYLNEQYSYDVLLKKSFDKDLKIESSDILKLFSAFAESGFFSDKLRDRLLIYVEKNIEGLHNNDFVKAMEAFSKGKYNFNNYQTLYDKIEFETSARLETLKPSLVVRSFYSFLSYGKMSVKLLKEFSEYFDKMQVENLSITHTNTLLESIVLAESYYLPEAFIEDPYWKENATLITESMKNVFERVLNNKLIGYFEDYKLQSFNLFVAVKTFELVFEVAQVFNVTIDLSKIANLHDILYYYSRDYHLFISDHIKLLPLGNLPSEMDNFSQNITLVHSRHLSADDITRIVYKYVCSNTTDRSLLPVVSFLETQFEKVTKDHFSKLVHITTTYGKLETTNKLLKVVKDLHAYGDIRYFFSIDDYITLAYDFLLYYFKQYHNLNQISSDEPFIKLEASGRSGYYLSSTDKQNIKVGLSNFLNLPIDDLVTHLFSLNPNKFNNVVFEQYKTIMLAISFADELVS